MCRRSSAAVTVGKYECDSKNLAITFARSKILLKEKLTIGDLVTSHQDYCWVHRYGPFIDLEKC